MEYSKEFRQRLTKEITSDEGCVLEVYNDHLGYKTVGVGHLVKPEDPEWEMNVGDPITQTRSDELFFYDINIVLKECEERFHNNWRDWPEEVKLIIANMAFNLGLTCLETDANSISPILAVPATVRKPSGARNRRSLATS